MSLNSNSHITEINGVGAKQAELFSHLSITTVKDLLFHIPFRYQDTSSIVSIEEFKALGEGTFLAKIEDIKTTYYRKKITTVKVSDDTGTLRLTYFNQAYLQKSLNKDHLYLFDAKITKKGNKQNIYNPKYEIFKEDPDNQTHLGRWIGTYPETKGLSSRTIRSKIKNIREDIGKVIKEPLPSEILEERKLLELNTAIENIHFPESEEDIRVAQKRLAFDEMLRIAIKIEKENKEKEGRKSIAMKIVTKEVNNFIKTLPFKLTDDQNKAVEDILNDLTKKSPSNRLLNGDVGSGKTIVSAIAILNTIRNNCSAILIAPTTVLAKQHYETFKNLFADLNIDIDLCISKEKIIKSADNKLIIGTHAILYNKILPPDLNLVIIDEQHRFGVEQREYFQKESNHSPHYLTMTATPIPRSLTEIFFGGMDVTEIRQKPKDRIDIKTYYTPYKKRDECFNWIREKISTGDNQAFVIYPLIEESEKLNAKAVETEAEHLRDIFKDLRVEVLHGRIAEREKSEILDKFKNKKIDILVSTTVIEVGIDIPDATVMVIEDAERFGLAQLHQLRGRVGRSNKESFCFVIPGPSVETDSPAEERLRFFAKNNSGFDVAEYDLQSRGPGEVYGLRQSGIPTFKVASIYDMDLLKESRYVAKKLLTEYNIDEINLENLFR